MSKYSFLLWLCLSGWLLASPLQAKVIERSEKEPEWVSKGEAGLNRQRSNDSYYFKIIRSFGADLSVLQKEKMVALANFIGQYNQIGGEARTDIRETTSNGSLDSYNEFAVSFVNQTRTDVFYARLIDEYWEYVSYPNGTQGYAYYVLFAVSRRASAPSFDDCYFTTNYGMKGFARSLVPGWGQMYKGSMGKGLAILGGEVACVAGIIVCENQRASYVKKMHEQPKYAQVYNTKADNWANGRNVCIGAAAALYVYNLIDAIVAKGARRIVVKPGHASVSLLPAVVDDGLGVGLAIRF